MIAGWPTPAGEAYAVSFDKGRRQQEETVPDMCTAHPSGDKVDDQAHEQDNGGGIKEPGRGFL